MENTNLTPEEVVEKLNNTFAEKMSNVPTNADVDALKSDLESLKNLEVKSQELEKSIAKFEGKLEAMSEKATEPKAEKLSIGQAVAKAYEKNLDAIKDAVEKGGKMSLNIKTTTITADYTGDYALTDFDSEVDRTVRKRYGILENVNRGQTGSKFVTYVQQTADSNIGWTTEGSAKTQGEPTWAEAGGRWLTAVVTPARLKSSPRPYPPLYSSEQLFVSLGAEGAVNGRLKL